MQLATALSKISQSPDFPGLFVIALQGYQNPSAFLGGFFLRLRDLAGELTFLDLEQVTLNESKAHVSMSFLGQRKLYVLRNFTLLDAASKKSWKAYIEEYEGPHGIVFFESLGPAPKGRHVAPKKASSSWSMPTQLLIEIPEKIDQTMYVQLFSFLYPGVAQDTAFLKNLFGKQEQLSLDDAYRVMSYQMVVGRNGKEFFSSWYTKLIASEASLFTLSQYLLGRNTRLFLTQWKACKDEYPLEFWVAYWSDQIWQATHFVTTVREKGYEEARKDFYKLPFAFLNNDWRQHNPHALVDAHAGLYELDYRSKNGGGAYALELWYHRFLRGSSTRSS